MKKVFSVYDKKAMFFSSPIVVDYPAQAERAFMQECQNPNSQLHNCAEDFALFQIGEFDEQKGTMISLPTPVHHVEAMAYIKVEQ